MAPAVAPFFRVLMKPADMIKKHSAQQQRQRERKIWQTAGKMKFKKYIYIILKMGRRQQQGAAAAGGGPEINVPKIV